MLTPKQVTEATLELQKQLKWESITQKSQVGFVLGSGLGAFADSLSERRVVPFDKIPHLPVSSVPGHAGQFVYGLTRQGVPVLVQQGRIHYYEGHSLPTVTLPIRLQHALGVKHLIITTSTGSINEAYNPGEFMLFTDHLNFPQSSPLMGLNAALGERFVDMSETYDVALNAALLTQAKRERSDIVLHEGVFAYVVGPQYETPAEIRALRTLGADVVSMSTVPEVLVARQCGLKITGIANITNYGSGLRKQIIEHSHVAKAAGEAAGKMVWLLENATKLVGNV